MKKLYNMKKKKENVTNNHEKSWLTEADTEIQMLKLADKVLK